MSRDMKSLEDVYTGLLEENFNVDQHNSENRELAKGTGPEAADGFGPETAIDPAKMSDKEKEDNAYGVDKNSQNIEQEDEKPLKERVNTSTMENEFDKIFKTVMEGSEFDDFGSEDDAGLEDDPLGGFDAEGDEGEEGPVTLTLEPHHVEALREVLAQLDGGEEGDELDPLDAEDDFGGEDDEEPLPEGTESHELKPQPDGKGKLQGKNNKVQGRASQTDGGASTTGAQGKEEAAKACPDGKSRLQGRNNKVGKPQGIFAR